MRGLKWFPSTALRAGTAALVFARVEPDDDAMYEKLGIQRSR
jgi:hypothetical protein